MPFRCELCQAEVEDFGMAPLRDEDVAWLDVPVNDSLSVGSIQTIRNLNREIENFVGLKRLAEDALRQRLSLQ